MLKWWESQGTARGETSVFRSMGYLVSVEGVRLGFGRIYATVATTTPPTPITPEDQIPAAQTASGGRELVSTQNGEVQAEVKKVIITITDSRRAVPFCSALDFYVLLMRLMLFAAELGAEGSFGNKYVYDRDNDFTLEIGAMSPEAAQEGELKGKMVGMALQLLGEFMATEKAENRFKQFYGKYYEDGTPKAQMATYQGQPPEGAGRGGEAGLVVL